MLFDPHKPFESFWDQDGYHFSLVLSGNGDGYQCRIDCTAPNGDVTTVQEPSRLLLDEAKRKAAEQLSQEIGARNLVPPDNLAQRIEWTVPDNRFAWVPSAGSPRR